MFNGLLHFGSWQVSFIAQSVKHKYDPKKTSSGQITIRSRHKCDISPLAYNVEILPSLSNLASDGDP